ncbi:glycosyltransferase WbuB [Candidatus Parcubacteria bacterium]|nr:MAG: glycosyltransferase WbuB [Candidatus Parcubacteria bacterium]
MSFMRVLIITHIFWPEGADFKNLALATRLVEHGHDVTVLTAFPNYPLGRLYDGYKLSWRQWEQVNGVRILRVPLYPDHSNSGMKRILNYGTFTLSVSTIGIALTGKVDVVFVYSPPMTLGLAAGLFKYLHRAPILLDVVDLWPDAILGSGMVSSDYLVKSSAWIAQVAYRLADKITVLTDGYASRLVSIGVPKEKISVMPPWADRKLYYRTKPNVEFGEKYNLEGKFCIIHAGNIGPFQDIDNVISAAELLRDIDTLRIIFVGAGHDLERMKKQKELRELNNVIFAGSYPVEEMSGILAWGKALFVSLRSDPYLAINLPSKVPSYMAAGCPIIVCADGEVEQLVNNYRLGITCKPGKPAMLADTFMRFMELPEKERHEMATRSRLTFEQLFDKDVLIDKYITMLEAMTSGQLVPTN